MDKCILFSLRGQSIAQFHCVQKYRGIRFYVDTTRYSRIKYCFTARYRLAYYVATIVGCEIISKYLEFINVAPDISVRVCTCVFVYVYYITRILLQKTGTSS